MQFVATKVPGVEVPPEIVRRVEQAKDAEQECEEIAFEQASQALAQPGVAGIHFISFRKDAGIAKLCTRLGVPPRSERESNGHSAPVAV
jgi:methylenetetrahydrofolate reductase (NADPH)